MNKLPNYCPVCNNEMHITTLCCNQCESTIDGVIKLPVLLRLTEEEQKFIIIFVKNSGNLKFMASYFKKSYPTIRKVLDSIIKKVNEAE